MFCLARSKKKNIKWRQPTSPTSFYDIAKFIPPINSHKKSRHFKQSQTHAKYKLHSLPFIPFHSFHRIREEWARRTQLTPNRSAKEQLWARSPIVYIYYMKFWNNAFRTQCGAAARSILFNFFLLAFSFRNVCVTHDFNSLWYPPTRECHPMKW